MNTEVNMMQASHQWATRPADQRFPTLEKLRESVYGRRLRARSVDIDTARLAVAVHDDRLVINSAISPCEPSHWSFGQLSGQVGAPAGYLRKLPLELAARCLNHGLEKSPRETLKFMTLSPEGGAPLSTLQAVTSPSYGRIWDADVVDAVGRIVERTGGRFFNPPAYVRTGGNSGNIMRSDNGWVTEPSGLYASDHDVFAFMIDGGSRLMPDDKGGMHRGFIVSNSETGARTFQLTTFLFRECCGNHIIWGARDINRLVIRHTKGGPYRFDSEAAPLLQAYADSAASTEEATIRKAAAALLPADDEGLYGFGARFKLTRSEIDEGRAYAKREEGDCRTAWQLVQGLTAYARGFDFIDARTDLEKRAGSILNAYAD